MKKIIYVCKHCHVRVVGPRDWHPVLGKEHKPNCPRKKNFG